MLLKRAIEKLVTGSVDFAILTSSSAVAFIFCFELTFLTFYTFRRWSGLYFYSILISAWGCALHAIAWSLHYLTDTPNVIFLVIVEFGWIQMVTGQSVVLYSRLHLVVRNRRVLKGILAMIIVDAICLHGPTIVITIGNNSKYNNQYWTKGMFVMERIQLLVFCFQETLISTIYIVSTVRLLRSTFHSATRSIMRLLITVNAFCLGMDVVIIALEYSGNHAAQVSIKAFLYAAKLKLEFHVLNQLMNVASKGLTEGNRWRAGDHVDNPYNSLEPTRDVFTDLDPNDYREENITGWPRGKLFGDGWRKRRKRATSESSSSSAQPSLGSKGKKPEPRDDYRWHENALSPSPLPAFSNHPITSKPLPTVKEELREEIVWGARGFPSQLPPIPRS